MYDLEKMKSRVLDIANPDIKYTQEDFNNEFGDTSNYNNHKIKLKFINKSNNPDVKYEKDGDSGFDLRANLTDNIVINQGETALIPTGIHIDLQRGYEAQVRSRSGLSLKKNVFVLNSPGTIDFSYVDEIKVILTNLGDERFIVYNGDRIAQIVISPVYSEHVIDLVRVDEFDTDKNRGGFGHTGLK